MKRTTLALALCLSLSAQADYLFTQTGWSGGGVVAGHFDGADTDGDNQISRFEVSDYGVTFSGNAEIPAFTQELSNLRFFAFNLDSAFVRTLTSFDAGATISFDGGNGLIHMPFHATETTERAYVTTVPEPSTWALLLSGLFALCGIAAVWRKAKDTEYDQTAIIVRSLDLRVHGVNKGKAGERQ
ncbi:MAG TPA: PEP-CTERM sorting domain-containing protein [Burkholderiales bacterium]|nr:PEP-CTERM sorting domain-containing protein [Burkholderiales bacterium]